MKRIILLFLLFCSYGCSAKITNSDEELSSYIEPNFTLLQKTQTYYLDSQAFYYPLVSKDTSSMEAVRSFIPINTYINFIVNNHNDSRKLLFSTSLNKIKSCVDKVNISNIWSGNLASDYQVKSYDKYDNLQERIHDNQVNLCVGAHVSLVFFNQEDEKKMVAEFYQKYYAVEFKDFWKQDIKKFSSDQIYETVTKQHRARINNELLPYFKKIEEFFITDCIQESPNQINQCKVDYSNWNIKSFN